MKKIIICLLITLMGYTAHAQRFNSYNNEWKIGVGVNAVGSLGTKSPFNKINKFAFQFPIMVSAEYQWSDQFSAEQDISLNGFKKGDSFDGGLISKEKLTYFSTNTNIKWYFSDYLFYANDLDLYISGGLGIFYIDEINTSANLSAGLQYWFNENIGARFQSTAKFATNPKDHLYANNHFQHTLQVLFRL